MLTRGSKNIFAPFCHLYRNRIGTECVEIILLVLYREIFTYVAEYEARNGATGD